MPTGKAPHKGVTGFRERTLQGIRVTLAACVVLILGAGDACAAGYAIREQSGTAIGNAFAGATAAAEDVSYMFFNPAGLTRHRGDQVLVLASSIMPRGEFSTDRATTVLGGNIGGDNGGDDISDDAVIPVLYLFKDLGPDLKAAFGLNAPFGLSTIYNKDWTGRYHSRESTMQIYIANPVLAWKATDKLSVAGGAQISYSRVKLTNAIDFGTFDVRSFSNAYGGTAAGNDGHVDMESRDWGLGYNFGFLYELNEDTRFGLAYRSRVRHDMRGDAQFDLGGSVGTSISGATGSFVPTGARANLPLPETLSFGFYHKLSPRWAVMGETAWTNWSVVKELRIQFDNASQSDTVADMNWHDSWFYALGATYELSKMTKLRFGVAYDQTPVPDKYRTPRIPGEDRRWIALGIEHKMGDNLSLSAGYVHISTENASLDLNTGGTGNTLRGNLSGSYDASVDILSLQVKWAF